MKKMENRVLKATNKIEKSCAFGAIRQGMIMLIPLLVVGYGALMIMSLPIAGYQDFIAHIWSGHVMDMLQFIYHGVNDIFAVLLAVTTSVSYALIKSGKKSGFVETGDAIVLAVVTLASFAGCAGIQYGSFSIKAFSNMNTFTALFVSLGAGFLYFKLKDINFMSVRNKEIDTDSGYMHAINGIGCTLGILFVFNLFHQVLYVTSGVNGVQELFELGVNRLFGSIDNNFWSGILIIVETHIFWFFGVHGNNVLDVVIKQNFSDVSVGIFSKSFQDVFVIMGGTGVMICLVIAVLLFAKTKSLRNVAGMAAPAVLFNISEIALFGVPVILNPIFIVPFLVVPILNFLITYAAMYFDIVPHVVASVEWTTPVLLSGYQATGSWKGVVLQLICIVIGVFVYRPFIRMFEMQRRQQMIQNVNQLVEEYKKQEESGVLFAFTKREDVCGNTARLLAGELKEAIENHSLFLMYQPQVDKNGHCSGAEALIRWNHPVFGNIYPPLIIQLAKELGIMHALDAAILDEAAAARARLTDYVDESFDISVNLTNASLQWDGLVEAVENSVKTHGVLFAFTKREDVCGNTARLLAGELKEAIENHSLFLMYQPQVDKNGHCSGAEALIRWNHPVFGNIYPPLIIQLAKELGIMHALDAAILDEAAAARARLTDYVDESFDISVNLTNASLQWDGLVEAVENSVKTHGISCSQLCLEITEQDAISSTEDVVHKIEELKAHGHRFLIDDFGMGHTSLLYLQTGFFAVVKLDGSLTRNVLENETNAEIIGSITKLGESIHFTTIAEWVESKEQLEKLKALGCDVFQGAYYSRAIGYEDLVEWLISYRDS